MYGMFDRFDHSLTRIQSTNTALQAQMLQDADTRTILQKAKDVGSVYEMDALTIGHVSESVQFSFDDQVLDSATYRAAWTKQNVRNQAPSSSSGLSMAAEGSRRKSIFGRLFTSKLKTEARNLDYLNVTTSPTSSTTVSSQSNLSQPASKTGRSRPSPSPHEQEKLQEQKKLQDQLLIWSGKGSVKMVQTLLDHGATASGPGSGKRTAKGRWINHQSDCLVAAVKAGSCEVAELLLRNGANSNSIDTDDDETCLAIAIRNDAGGDQMLKTLLSHGAKTDMDFRLPAIRTNLHYDHIGNILHYVLAEAPNYWRMTEMMRVLEVWLTSGTMQELLQSWSVSYNIMKPRPKDLNSISYYTPLQWLCLRRASGGQDLDACFSSLLTYLVERGAQLHAPLGGCARYDHHDLLLSLCSLKLGHASTVHALVEAGADANTSDTKGLRLSALQRACVAKNEYTALVLVDAGADVHILNLEGKSILLLAISQRMTDLAMSVVARGADVNEADITGTTPLIEECKQPRANIALVRSLLAAGAAITKTDDAGMNAWNYACQQSDVKTVAYLQEQVDYRAAEGSGKLNHSGLWHAVHGDNNIVLDFLLGQLTLNRAGELGHLAEAAHTTQGFKCVRVFLRRGVAYESVLKKGSYEWGVFFRIQQEMLSERKT
jgi:ankyrin repeat protein